MAFQPIRHDCERDDAAGITRLYPGPRFARVGGVWLPVEDALQVQYDQATESFSVSLGSASIRLVPRAATLESIAASKADDTAVALRAFGQKVDLASVADSLEYDVTTTGNVTRSADGLGYTFTDADAPVGLYLHDWKRRFGDSLAVQDGAISIDLLATKAALLPAADSGGLTIGRGELTRPLDVNAPAPEPVVLDLDPTATLLTVRVASAQVGSTYSNINDAMAAARLLPTGTISSETGDLQVGGWSGDYYDGDDDWYSVGLHRGLLRFDTSAHPYVSSAVLHFYLYDYEGNSNGQSIVMRTRCDFGTFAGDAFHKAMLGYAAGSVGNLGSTEEWRTIAIDNIAAGYASSATFDIALLFAIDSNGGTPPDSDGDWYASLLGKTGDSLEWPYLELADAPPPTRSTCLALTGVGA